MQSDTAESSSSEHKSPTVCYLCRQRKTKCDRNLPKCGFCIKAKVACQYVAKPKKRGLRAGYVSELENRIEQLEHEVTNLKDHQQPSISQASILGVTPFTDQPTPVSIPQSLATPSSTQSTPSKNRQNHPESNAAVADLMSLPPSFLYSLADLWFKETQPWCPILDRQHIQTALGNLPSPVDHVEDVVLRAVLSLEIAYSTQAIALGYRGRGRLSQHLRSQVLSEALSKASLSSLQALMIIAILDYGSDNIPSTFSLLSVCRRMCEHIGLFRKLLDHIEMQNPAQVGPPSGDSVKSDEVSVPLTWGTLSLDAVSTLGVSWRDVSAALVDHLSSIAYVSTPDLRDSFKTHIHLAAIGLQPVHAFIHDYSRGRYLEAGDEALTICDEIYHNLLSYAKSQSTMSYTILENGFIDFDPNLVHTSILAHASIIITYQRLVDFNSETSAIPTQRCLQACDEVIATIRGISDADAELNTPLLATFFFVAARFKLLMYRSLSEPREASFDTFMHGINMCGRRWPLARRLDIVLRAAIIEVDTGNKSSLPESFWNLAQSHLDISEQLKEWVEEYKPGLYVGSLNGPYV